jgi:MFS family permease
MAVAFVCGIGVDVFFVVWQTALQTHVPKESLSRVSSYDAFGSLLFSPLGLLVAGPLAQRFGTSVVLAIFGVLFTLILFVILSFRAVRDLPGSTEKEEAVPA